MNSATLGVPYTFVGLGQKERKKKLGVNLALKIESFNSAPVAFVNCSRLSFQSINFCSCIVEEMVGATTVF